MKKIKILLVLLTITQLAFAQDPVSPKLPSMGILLGVDYSNLAAEIREPGNTYLYREIESERGVGFSLGVFYRLRLNKNFTILPQAILAFQNANVDFSLPNQTIQKVEIQPLTIEFPVHFVYTTNFSKGINPSIAIGARYIYDITERADDLQQDLNRSDFALDIGGGLEFDFKMFKMKPELLYSFGTTNLRNNNNDLLNYEIGKIIRDKFSIRMTFY